MALGDAYLTGPQLAGYMGISTTNPDTVRDTELQAAATSASKAINRACGRDFNNQTDASARLFIPSAPRFVVTDDIYSTDSLVVEVLEYGNVVMTLTGTEYELTPLNGIVDGEPRPYTGFRLPWPWHSWFWAGTRIRVTAKWGWAAVPDDIVQATKILGAEFYKLKDAPLGVVQPGSGNNSTFLSHVRDVPQAWNLACPYERQESKVFLG